MIGVSVKTLYNWRQTGIGPPFRRIGGRLLYSIEGVRWWLNANDDNHATPDAQARRDGPGGVA